MATAATVSGAVGKGASTSSVVDELTKRFEAAVEAERVDIDTVRKLAAMGNAILLGHTIQGSSGLAACCS